MSNYYNNTWTTEGGRSFSLVQVNSFLQKVFLIMFAGLAITGITSLLLGQAMLPAWDAYRQGMGDGGLAMQIFGSPLKWVVMLSPLAFVLILSFGIYRMSYAAATLMFGLFAVVMGVSISYIFLIYTGGSIALTFFVASGMFGGMALFGMTTKLDLTKLGTYLYMILIGLVIAVVVNLFLGSGMMSMVISGIGVVLFTLLTAYDVWRLKQAEYMEHADPSTLGKFAIMGALSLYLNFINLFLFLLRFMGTSRN